MQERRTSVRISYPCRAQYCPSANLEPKDGRLLNVSDRGAGLLIREPHGEGERLTVNFSFPGAEDAFTATGAVRWCQPPSLGSRWHTVGLGWLPLDEATRRQLHRFLQTSVHAASFSTTHRRASAPPARRFAIVPIVLGWAAVGALVGMIFFWVVSLQQENRRLASTLLEHNAAIEHLHHLKTQLTQELGTATTRLAESSAEISRIDRRGQALSDQVEQLSTDLEQTRTSYVQVRQDREQLMERVLALEQERTSLARRLASMEELRTAIRESIESRRRTLQQAQRISVVQAQRIADQRRLAEGNQGFLVREGQTTLGHSTVWIRVHEPEESIRRISPAQTPAPGEDAPSPNTTPPAAAGE